jgi:hypothetical protein
VRRRFKKFRAPIFVLAILLSYFLAYFQSNNLGETHFFALDATLDNFDDAGQEDFVTDSPADPNGILSAFFVTPGHLGINLFRGSFLLPFQVFPFEKKFHLRC